MKTKEYVEKYKLNLDDKFNHSEFISDLTIDFVSLLEVGKATENVKGFNNAVSAIKMKFDAINNKTVGQIPEKLWNYFYATVVVKMKAELFPEFVKREKEEFDERKRAYERRKEYEKRFYNFFEEAFFQSILSDLFKSRKPTDSFNELGISDSSTSEEVKMKYRELCKTHHPDKGGSHDNFVKITEAKNKCLAFLSKD